MNGPYTLATECVGALPIIDHFLARLGVDRALAQRVPAGDPSVRMAPATALGVALRCLCLRHQPLYALREWSQPFAPELLGLHADQLPLLNDDRVGRALTRLFDADRASLLTELIVGMVAAFGLDCSQLHNDSTTVTFSGAYTQATGRPRGNKPTPAITYGHNKDHRPDLKQLLWILTVSADGAVPLAYRTEPGNTVDDTTHVTTWDSLVKLLGRSDFLYVADTKLCSREAMDHIACRGGRFLTVLPRTRAEDGDFRTWIVSNVPDWQEVARQPGPRHDDPPAIWWALPWTKTSAEGYRICWFRSSQKIATDAARRTNRIRRACDELDNLAKRLAGPRSRFHDITAVENAVANILERTETLDLITVGITPEPDTTYRQDRPGRPGPDTRYRAVTRPRFRLTPSVNAAVVCAEAASDGCFPLVTNDFALSPADLLRAYKYQPNLEQRHAELKGPMEVAPVFLKDPARIEGLLCLEFLALLTRALIQRELRRAMELRGLDKLSLYPEDRDCTAPTATRILDIFAGVARHHLLDQDGHLVQAFPPHLNDLQLKVLDLLGVPPSAYVA